MNNKLSSILGLDRVYHGPFAHLALMILILCSFNQIRVNHIIHKGPALHFITPFGWLPVSLVESLNFAHVISIMYIVCALAWMVGLLPRVMAIFSTVLFIFHQSLYLQRIVYADHTFYITTQLMILFMGWTIFYSCKNNKNRILRVFDYLNVYPCWLIQMSIVTFSLFYGYSFVAKMWDSGLSWANGSSFQLWLFLWGDNSSIFTQAVLKHLSLAKWLQMMTLLFEFFAFFLVCMRKKGRIAWSIALVLFSIGNEVFFNYGFVENTILGICLIIPWEKGIRCKKYEK